ncbi:MAG: hypothetical protein FJX74_17500, partial [Armatimonadetes bacterium]|nr:hypothetical protein [Armatimonadota bacterium]
MIPRPAPHAAQAALLCAAAGGDESAVGPDVRETLATLGFDDPQRALANLRALRRAAGAERFAALTTRLTDLLPAGADPDMALNNLERIL